MSKQSLLLVDGDTRSLRVLEVSLRKAGFSVTPAVSVGDALEKLEINAPDLIISETKFATDLDGFELRRRLRSMPEWADIPFIFLTAETAIENKIKGLELGVDDYLTKPIYIKEIVTRINILLQKRQRQFLDLRKDGTRFAGRVADMPVVDVIQTIEVSRKSGVIQFTGGPNRQAAIYFRDGKVIDAEAGTLQGEDAVYRLLTWSDGEFEVEFRTVRRREVITTSSQGLLMEGMRRLDEWSRLLEQLPPLSHRFEIDAAELGARLGEVPDDNNRILRLFDGKRTLLEVIDASDFGDLECLQAISRLYFEGLLIDLDPGVRTKRDTGKPGPLLVVEELAPTPIETAASGPIDLAALEARAARSDDSSAATSGVDAAAAAHESASAASVDGSIAKEPLASPRELAVASHETADGPRFPRARRASSEPVADNDVVAEEEIHGPLSGGYRPSSLRLIDEAVAAAQLIEPSLFEPEELAALGIKPGATETPAAPDATGEAAPRARAPSPGEISAEHASSRANDAPASADELPRDDTPPTDSPEAAAIARVKLELRTSDPRIDNARDIVEKTPGVSESAEPSNGARRHRKTLPPPIPRAAAKAAKPIDEERAAEPAKPLEEEVPLLDSSLLASGEHPIPSDEQLEDVPLLDSSLLTSGEHRVPTDEEIAAAQAAAATPPAPEKDAAPSGANDAAVERDSAAPAAVDSEDSSGVPTPIEPSSEETGADLVDEVRTDPSLRKYVPRREDSQGLRMIGSLGRDRAEASGELRPPAGSSATNGETQRELVTIMPRRKTGEFAQLRAEDLAKAANGTSAVAEAQPAAPADHAARAGKPADTGNPAAEAKPASAKPAVEPPSRPPPRRVSVEGGVVAKRKGPGPGAQALMVLASVLLGAAVYSQCRKQKPATEPVATTYEDAATIATAPLDAAEYRGFGADAGVGMAPADARVTATSPPADARVTATPPPPDAATVAVRPDARPVDAGIDKNKEARILYDKAHTALEDGDPAAALELLEESLKLRRTSRTLLERARALQRLGRIDDALASINAALAMNENNAAAWEQKGMLLWSAQRYSDARPALEMYLQLDPDGRRSEVIRSMLSEPK